MKSWRKQSKQSGKSPYETHEDAVFQTSPLSDFCLRTENNATGVCVQLPRAVRAAAAGMEIERKRK